MLRAVRSALAAFLLLFTKYLAMPVANRRTESQIQLIPTRANWYQGAIQCPDATVPSNRATQAPRLTPQRHGDSHGGAHVLGLAIEGIEGGVSTYLSARAQA